MKLSKLLVQPLLYMTAANGMEFIGKQLDFHWIILDENFTPITTGLNSLEFAFHAATSF